MNNHDDNNQLSPSQLAKMGWNRERRKFYRNGEYTIEFVYNVRVWVIYNKRREALFNFDTLKGAVTWFERNPEAFGR